MNPTYESVCYQNTNHAEVLQVEFDEEVISYDAIIEEFWKCHDPTTLNKQGPDIGNQYRSVIYYFNDQQKIIAENSKDRNQTAFQNQIVTKISKADIFYRAEEYHQKYVKKAKS